MPSSVDSRRRRCRSVTRYVNFPRRREPPRTESRRAIAQRGGFKIKINFRYYDEHVVHLPDCYQPTDPQRVIGPTPSRTDAGLPETGFVFCSFNETHKITPNMFGIWMHLLQSVPGSVLWLLASNRWVPDNLPREALVRGIDPRRLIFAPRLSQTAHLGRLALADLVLDTRPCNGHTTASEKIHLRGGGRYSGEPAADVICIRGKSCDRRCSGYANPPRLKFGCQPKQ